LLSTEAWARSHGISVKPNLPEIRGYNKPYARSAKKIAVRTVILQGVVAVGFHVDPKPVIKWFKNQHVWEHVTPEEKAFLLNRSPTSQLRNSFCWHQEAEWTLLWVIGKVESLGLPTRQCDTKRLVDEIIPPLGSDIAQFISTARLRKPGKLLAEDDRTYNLWCYAQAARRKGSVPEDLVWPVLYERRYAFEWLDGFQEWDDVTCDA
jgi:hypothetical protein